MLEVRRHVAACRAAAREPRSPEPGAAPPSELFKLTQLVAAARGPGAYIGGMMGVTGQAPKSGIGMAAGELAS